MPQLENQSFARPAPSDILRSTRVIAVLRADHAKEYAPVIEALHRGGVLSIELTLSTPGVFEELPLLRRRFGDAVEIGVGTVTTATEAETAMDLGAAYVVTPVTQADVITACTVRGVPVFPGGLTPTELHAGWKLGATAVKVFPASIFGPGYFSQLRGPFPELQIVPSGGVHIEDVPSWIKAGALAVSLGGPLLGDAFSGGDLGKLTSRAQHVRALADEASAP